MKLTRRHFNAGLAATAAAGTIVGSVGRALAARTLIYGNAGNANSNSNQFAAKWLAEVTKRTNGELKFDIKAGTLGGEKDILDGCALGTVDVYNGAFTGLREFDVFYAPYFARDSVHAAKIVNGLLYDQLNAAIAKRYPTVRMLSVGRAGPWKLFTNTKLESFGDAKGMKIRAPQIEGVVAGLQQLGAKPTVIPFNELYSALQQGVVDGMATLGSLMISQKFYEVVKHVYRNDWGIGLDKMMFNTNTWDSLGAAHQKIIADSFAEMEPTDYFAATMAAEESNFAKWEEFNGAGSAPKLDASEAQKLLAPAIAKLADEIFGKGTYDKIAAI